MKKVARTFQQTAQLEYLHMFSLLTCMYTVYVIIDCFCNLGVNHTILDTGNYGLSEIKCNWLVFLSSCKLPTLCHTGFCVNDKIFPLCSSGVSLGLSVYMITWVCVCVCVLTSPFLHINTWSNWSGHAVLGVRRLLVKIELLLGWLKGWIGFTLSCKMPAPLWPSPEFSLSWEKCHSQTIF